MRTYIFIIFNLILFAYSSNAQVVTTTGFEQYEKRTRFSVSDSIVFKKYADSLSQVFVGELLTGYVYTTIHEIASDIQIKYSVNNGEILTTQTDSLGRFYILSPIIPDKVQIYYFPCP